VPHAIHEALGPNELRCKQRKAEKNDQPPGTGGEKHKDTHQEKCKPGKNAKKAANLLNCPKDHWPSGAEAGRASILKGIFVAGNSF
jgi:hypothetical protein